MTDITGRWSAVAAGVALWVMCLCCVPIPPDRGGTIPPPDINDGTPPVIFDDDSGDDAGAAIVMVAIFDVLIEASSSATAGIVIDAVLTVSSEVSADESAAAIVEATLQDEINDPNEQIGVAGGVFLTAGTELAGGFFVLQQNDGSSVVADFSSTGSSPNPNRFILPDGGDTFVPGLIGVTYQVESGSQFSFVIRGDEVSGVLNLIGTPITAPGAVDLYNGTFSGTRR